MKEIEKDGEKAERIRTSNTLFARKFCPLIKDNCRDTCVCFSKAMFTETNHFLEASCTSPIIDGVICVENDLNY